MVDNTVLEFGEHLFNSKLTNNNVKLNFVSLRFCNTNNHVLIRNVTPSMIVNMSLYNEFDGTCRLFAKSSMKILNPNINSNMGDNSDIDTLIIVRYGFVVSDKFGNKYLYGINDLDIELLNKFENMVSDTIITAYSHFGEIKVGFEYKYIMSELLSRNEYNYRISHKVDR